MGINHIAREGLCPPNPLLCCQQALWKRGLYQAMAASEGLLGRALHSPPLFPWLQRREREGEVEHNASCVQPGVSSNIKPPGY